MKRLMKAVLLTVMAICPILVKSQSFTFSIKENVVWHRQPDSTKSEIKSLSISWDWKHKDSTRKQNNYFKLIPLINDDGVFKENEYPFIIDTNGENGQYTFYLTLLGTNKDDGAKCTKFFKVVDREDNIQSLVKIVVQNPSAQLNKDYPAFISLGTNIDFIRGIQAKNINAVVETFQPDVFSHEWTNIRKKIHKNLFKKDGKQKYSWGVGAGIYQNTIIGYDSFNNIGLDNIQYTQLGFPSNDSVQYQRLKYNTSVVTNIENLGFYGKLFFTIKEFENPTRKVSSAWYWGIHTEGILRTFTYNYTFTNLFSDSIRVHFSQVDSISRVSRTQRTQSVVTRFEYYPGITMPFVIKHKLADLYISPTVGVILGRGYTLGPETPREEFQFFFLNTFRLIDKKTGIILGGEIRYVGKNVPAYTNIYLSKLINIEKLFKNGGE